MPIGLLCSLILIFWLWLDFNGLLLSVISTSFFFGMEGTPFLEARIGAIALFTFSSPLVYALFLSRRSFRGALQLLMAAQLACYLVCLFVRDPEVFAAATVTGRFVSGLSVLSLLRRFRDFGPFELPALAILLAFTVYLVARLLNDGLPTAVAPTPGSALLLCVLFFVAMSSGHVRPPIPDPGDRAALSLQLSTVSFVLLVDVCIALICNLYLWDARTPSWHAAVYLISFCTGTLGGFLAARSLSWRVAWLPGLLASGAAGLGWGLYVVLNPPYGLGSGLLAHGAGCYGLAVFWYLFARRLKHHADARPGALPIAGLQISNLASMGVLTHFLLTAVPSGFWVVFGLAIPLMSGVELASPLRSRTRGSDRVSSWWLATLLVPAIASLLYLLPSDERRSEAEVSPVISVLTTNVRYGWTDDYRFEPERHLSWLEEHPADLIGMQEVNRGNFYGAFSDLYQSYRARLRGRALYGDASFGFGNALLTRLELSDSSVVSYRESDMIRRSFTWALVLHAGREIDVFVTHVSHHAHPNPVRQAQIAELLERIGRSQRPWILMGDLNAQPDEPEIKALLEVSHPIFRDRPELLLEPTHPARDPIVRLDYIFFSDHFDLVEQRILDNQGHTDHRPVYSVLRLAR